MKKNITILGGGQAAIFAALEIRKNDKESSIKILGNEKYLPYERPPLSKDFLLDKKQQEDLYFYSSNLLKEQNLDYINVSIDKVDFENRKLFSKKNNIYPYDQLLIASGSENRKLNLENNLENEIYYLRSLDDAKIIKEKVLNKKKIAIIGGGFIGLEIASSLSQKKKEIFIIEIGRQLMGRVVPDQVAKLVQQTHEKYGNQIILNQQVAKIAKKNNTFKIFLTDDTEVEAEMIVAGIGSIPSVKLFENSKLELNNGIVTNEYCETSIKDVYAAGDVSNFYHSVYRRNIRLESYQHAQNHGICAGKNIAGIKTKYSSIPWMWSDQFNFNLQLTGFCEDYNEVVKRGENIDEGIIYFFLDKRKIKGACGIGLIGKIGRDIKVATKLAENNVEVDHKTLADKTYKLNKLIKSKNN